MHHVENDSIHVIGIYHILTKLEVNMKCFVFGVGVGAVVMLAGCSTPPPPRPYVPPILTHQPVHLANHLSVGDSKEYVLKLMGEPAQRDVAGALEALQWCNSRRGEADDFALVVLKNSKVAQVQSYRNNGYYSDCPSGIKSFDFRVPDHVQEIRRR